MIHHRLHHVARPAFFALALLVSPCLLHVATAQDPEAEGVPQSQEELQAQFDTSMKEGNEQLLAKDYQAALKSFSKAVQLSQGISAPALLGRASARKGLEEYAPALEDIRNIQTYASTDDQIMAAAHNLRGEIYMDQNAYGDALADLEVAVEKAPSVPIHQYNLGKVYALLGGPEEGRKALTKWLESGSEDTEKNAEAYRLRAQSLAQLSKYEEAYSDIEDSLAIDPENHETYSLKGFVLGLEEKYEEAAEAFNMAIEKYEPEEDSDLPYVLAHLRRASALEEAAKLVEDDLPKQHALYAAQRDECQRLIDGLPDRPQSAGDKAAALFTRGVAERMLGDLTVAVKSFSDAIDINPGMAPAYFRRGICFYHLGEELLAIRDFDQARQIDVESPHAALWKGRTYAKLGKHYEALKSYGQALSVSDRYTDAYVNRGLTYVRLEELDRAIDDFNDAIRLQPTNGRFYYYRGVAYAATGNHEKAIKSLAMAVDLDDQLADAYLRLADELKAIGRSDLSRDYQKRGNELKAG